MFRTRELAFMNLPDYYHATLSSSTTPRRGRSQKYRAQSAVKITFHTDLLNTNIFWGKNAWELRRSQTKGTGGAKAPGRAMLGSSLTCRNINMKMEKQSQAQGIVSSFRDLHVTMITIAIINSGDTRCQTLFLGILGVLRYIILITIL